MTQTDDLAVLNRRNVRARLHIDDDTEFINSVVIDRNPSEYPDPYLREVFDADLLSDYLTRVRQAITSYTPDSDEEATACREFYAREHERVNAQIGRLTFPAPDTPGLADLLSQFDHSGLNTGYGLSGRDIDWDVYDKLFTSDLDDLRYLAAHYKVHHRNHGGGQTSHIELRVMNAIRYVRGDPTVSLENVITFADIDSATEHLTIEIGGDPIELTRGMSFANIKAELERLNDMFTSLPIALAFANIGKLTNYHHPKIANGHYNYFDTNISAPITEKTGNTHRNIVAHEFFHSLQDIIGTRDMMVGNTAVDFGASPDEWDVVVFPNVKERFADIHKQVKHQWFQFRTGDIPELCEYQTKNIHEMYAVAFEAYIENPDTLREHQPQVYDLLDTLVTTPRAV